MVGRRGMGLAGRVYNALRLGVDGVTRPVSGTKKDIRKFFTLSTWYLLPLTEIEGRLSRDLYG